MDFKSKSDFLVKMMFKVLKAAVVLVPPCKASFWFVFQLSMVTRCTIFTDILVVLPKKNTHTDKKKIIILSKITQP